MPPLLALTTLGKMAQTGYLFAHFSAMLPKEARASRGGIVRQFLLTNVANANTG
jgi:hypothetical protein